MILPLYPKPGKETVINKPGHYKGYFANSCPGASHFPFKPADNWKVKFCSHVGKGTHGGCRGCIMVLIDLTYIEEHKKIKNEVPVIMIPTQGNGDTDYCFDEPIESNTKIDIFKGVIIGIILFIILKVIK